MTTIASRENAVTSRTRWGLRSGLYNKEYGRLCSHSSRLVAEQSCRSPSSCRAALNGPLPADKCFVRIPEATTARAAAKCPNSRPSRLGSSDRSLLHTQQSNQAH